MAKIVACAQFAPVPGDVEENLRTIERLTAEAEGVDLVVFPELATTGYLSAEWMSELAETVPGKMFDELAAIARDHARALAVGWPELDLQDGTRHNSFLVIDETGRLVLRYRKSHLWHGESAWATPGSAFHATVCNGVVCGAWVCYDTRFPEVARLVALAGAQVGLVGSAWLGPPEEWELALRARALDNNIYVAAAAMQGTTGGGEPLYGGSLIVGPSGEVLARAEEGPETFISAVVDTAEINARRERLPLFVDRRPDLYDGLTWGR